MGTEKKVVTGRPVGKREEKKIMARMGKTERTPRQRQEGIRLVCAVLMAACVLFTMGWGICQMVKNINTAGQYPYVNLNSPENEVVVNNSENAGKKIDTEKLAQKVLDRVSFDVELEKLEDSVAEAMITVAEGTSLQVYMGNGTHADELVIMTAMSEEDAKVNQTNAETHLAEMRKQFAEYLPEEVKKLDQAVQIRTGSYVIVCVTADADTAKKTIDAFLKQ